MTSDFAQHILDTKHNKTLTIIDVNNKGIYMKTIRGFHLCNNRKNTSNSKIIHSQKSFIFEILVQYNEVEDTTD